MARRGRDEGSVYRRNSDNLWVASLLAPDPKRPGEKRRVVFYGGTRAQAVAKMEQSRDRVKVGKPAKDSDMTVSDLVERWISKGLPSSELEQSTIDLYVLIARAHVQPSPFGDIPLSRLVPSDIDALLLTKKQPGAKDPTHGYKDSTRRTIYAVLRRILGFAVRDRLVGSNVCVEVKRPTLKDQKEAYYLSVAEAQQVLDESRDHRLSAYFRVPMSLALRRGEALGIRWGDVDLDGEVLHVTGQLIRDSQGLRRKDTKTKKGRRTVAMPPQLVTELKAHRLRQIEERLAAGSNWVGSDYVFTTVLGGPIEPRGMLRIVQKVERRLGLMDADIHCLRHTAASLLHNQGVPLRTISEILGHSSLAVTSDIYLHIAPELKRDAADRMGDALAW